MDVGLLQVEVINDVRQHGPAHGGGSREHPPTQLPQASASPCGPGQ